MNNYFSEIKKVFNILPKKLNNKFKIMLVLLSLSGFLESLSLGLFIPLITIVLEERTSFNLFNFTFDFSNYETSKLIIISTILILGIYFVKSLYLTFLEFNLQKLVSKIRAELTIVLYKKYIYSNYNFHLKNNSSILLRNLTTEVVAFSNGVIEPILLLFKEIFIIIFIIALLFLFNYKISFFVILFGLFFVFLIKILLKKLLYNLSKKEIGYRGNTNQIILETLQGIKIVKSFKKEDFFVNKLINILNLSAYVRYKQTAIKSLPRIWVELFVFTILILLGVYFFILEFTLTSYLTFISVFLLSMVKILPSVLSITRVINSYQSHKPSIDLLKDEFSKGIIEDSNEKKEFSKINLQKNYILKNISFKYEGQKKNTLYNVNLEINCNKDMIGIYGKSGSGKTTLIDILTGLHIPNEGQIFLDEKETDNLELRGKIFGYVPQSIYLFDDSIKNNILLFKNFEYFNLNYEKILEQCELSNFIQSLPQKDNTIIGEHGSKISGGQQQRIGIARALSHDPKMLIFDEATNALDKNTEEKIFKILKDISNDKSIIIITHNEDLLKYCNKTFYLVDGSLTKTK